MKKKAIFSIFLVLFLIEASCSTELPPEIPLDNQNPSTLRDLISRKWVGTNTIPTFFPFADGGVKRVSCFSFTDAIKTNVTEYEWKSDVYSNNNDPQEIWFKTRVDTNGDHKLSPVRLTSGHAPFFSILRYNNLGNALAFFVTNKEDGKSYSASITIGDVKEDVVKDGGGTADNPDYSQHILYMPVLFRNFKTNASPATVQFNYLINLATSKTNAPRDWTDVYEEIIKETRYGLVANQWTTYYEVTDIENGAHGCYNP